MAAAGKNILMYPILEKRLLAEGIWLMQVLAPRVAHSAQPGQFVIVRADEHGERIPLTISDYDPAQGSVTIVTQAIGASTRKICSLDAGDAFADFAGPLGHPSEFVTMQPGELRRRRYLFVAGGVGTAPVYPQVKWLREHGVAADVIIGAKTRDMLIYTNAMRAVAENLYIATDDGSEGFKGLVTQVVEELVEKQGRHYDECVAIGPMVMMKFVALTTKKYGLRTTVSLNALMVDGTGMCGACRVTDGGRTRFTPTQKQKPRTIHSFRHPKLKCCLPILFLQILLRKDLRNYPHSLRILPDSRSPYLLQVLIL